MLEPEPSVLRLLGEACRRRVAVSAQYATLSSGVTRERVLFPTQVVRLAQRWHLRAWSPDRNEYRDFTLGRLSKLKLLADPMPADVPVDELWDRQVVLRVTAHSALTPEQEKIVRNEYFGGTTGRRMTVREALLQYWMTELRIAEDTETQRPPEFLLEVRKP